MLWVLATGSLQSPRTARLLQEQAVMMPTGLLHASAGAQEALTGSSPTYANVTNRYLSLKGEYRVNDVWFMNDKTTLFLSTLKDDSSFGKPVLYSDFMPAIETDTMPKAIDFFD
mgnify:CR=1 FL=1